VDVCRLGRAQECVDELAATLRKGEHLDLRLEADLVWGRILLASGQFEEAMRRLHHVQSRAKNAGLQIIAALAEALVGETLWAMEDHEAGFETCRNAVAALKRTSHVPATADACAAQARAMGTKLSAEQIFEPVMDYIEQQPCVALHLEGTLASARFAKAHGEDPQPFYDQAQHTLGDISNALSDTDQAAMYLHPWAREVRLGLGSA